MKVKVTGPCPVDGHQTGESFDETPGPRLDFWIRAGHVEEALESYPKSRPKQKAEDSDKDGE